MRGHGVKLKILKDVKPSRALIDKLENEIVEFFRYEFYLPLIKELFPKDTLENASNIFIKSIATNKIIFNQGKFYGKFSAAISKELIKMGAKFNRKTGTFDITLDKIPVDVRGTISIAESRLIQKINRIDDRLSKILPEEIADKLKIENVFDATLYKMNKDIEATLKGISVQPDLTDEGRALISKEYTNTVKLKIKDWTQAEIVKLRQNVQDSTFSGNRYEYIQKSIEESYGVSQSKAKFLARQETNLLLSKFKQARYKSADVNKYKWVCVAGSLNHPVRRMHKDLDGTIHSWDDPPIVDEKGNRKHPGEDWGCRCAARPVVGF